MKILMDIPSFSGGKIDSNSDDTDSDESSYDDDEENEITQNRTSNYELQCGELYKFEFLLSDKNGQVLETQLWNKYNLRYKAMNVLHESFGASACEIIMENDEETSPTVVSFIKIHSAETSLTLRFLCEFEGFPPFQSPPIPISIIPGKPEKVYLEKPLLTAKTYDEITIRARLSDSSDNHVCPNGNIKLTLVNQSSFLNTNSVNSNNQLTASTNNAAANASNILPWDQKCNFHEIPFDQSSGWYVKTVQVIREGSFNFNVEANEIVRKSKRKNKTMEINSSFLTIEVSVATDIATAINFPDDFQTTLVAGNKLGKINAVAVSGSMNVLPHSLTYKLLNEKKEPINLDSILYKAQQYRLKVFIDKTHTKHKQTISAEKLITVIPSAPHKLDFPSNQSLSGLYLSFLPSFFSFLSLPLPSSLSLSPLSYYLAPLSSLAFLFLPTSSFHSFILSSSPLPPHFFIQ